MKNTLIKIMKNTLIIILTILIFLIAYGKIRTWMDKGITEDVISNELNEGGKKND